MISVIVGTVSIHSPKARDRLRNKLDQKDHTLSDIREVVVNFAQTLAREYEVAEQSSAKEGAGSDAKVREEATKKLEGDKQKLELVKSIAITFPVPADAGDAEGEAASGGAGGEAGSEGGMEVEAS